MSLRPPRTANPPGDRPVWLAENPHLACVCSCTHCRDGRHRKCGHLVSCVLVPVADLLAEVAPT